MKQDIIDELCKVKVGHFVLSALRDLLEHDYYLLNVDANERAITHRLAMHLQTHLPDWNVDCEYNRDGTDIKKILEKAPPTSIDNPQAITVYPDIIVHKRGQAENYLVIEVKKSTSSNNHSFDLFKLKAYSDKSQLGYAEALFIELATGNEACVASVQWVHH